MADDTTTTYSEAQISDAQDRSKALRAALEALPYHGEGDPARQKITEELGPLALIAHAAPPVEVDTSGPSAERRGQAHDRIGELRAALAGLDEGHPHREGILDQIIAETTVRDAPGERLLSRLPFNVRQAPLPEEPPTPAAVELPDVPPLGGTTQWRLEALREAQAVADRAGYGIRMPALHAITARAHREGQRWNAETLLQHWTGQYGSEQTERLRAAATTFETAVLAGTPKYRAQLEYLEQLHNPELVEAALRTWQLWPL